MRVWQLLIVVIVYIGTTALAIVLNQTGHKFAGNAIGALLIGGITIGVIFWAIVLDKPQAWSGMPWQTRLKKVLTFQK